jgi:hypothetical protein
MEPLQELVVEVVWQEEEEKKNMEQTQAECVEMINEEITVQVLYVLKENTAQAEAQERELTYKFHTLAGDVEEVKKF